MNAHRGFSLIEVLVSLLLMTGASITLLKHQWQISQLFNQLSTQTYRVFQQDTVSEKLLSDGSINALGKLYAVRNVD
jgi:prepilin-type N-terminal cleavage/methylation domain-containing protein